MAIVDPLKLVHSTLETLGAPFAGRDAECILLAIGLQESAFLTRRQDHGPAHGFWQFETEAVKDFVDNGEERLQQAVINTGLRLVSAELYTGITTADGDQAACIMARDLIFRDPAALPNIGDLNHAWHYYIRNWRPGKPSFNRWEHSYARAVVLLGE